MMASFSLGVQEEGLQEPPWVILSFEVKERSSVAKFKFLSGADFGLKKAC
jgi:hypothetical protein